jgi:hypothetical protein
MEETQLKHNFTDREAWQTALNAAPASALLKSRSLGGSKKSKYLPIEHQQAIQDIFFDEFDVIDEKYQVIFNEVICTVKCQGLPSYPNSEHRIFTGSGAKPIQCDSGALVYKFPRGKKTNALEYNLPAARTTAISKALETIGNKFGRNLGRAVVDDHNMVESFKNSKEKNKKSKKNTKKSKK